MFPQLYSEMADVLLAAIEAEDDAVLVSGTTVQVMFDYERERSTRLPDDLRAILEAFDGPLE